MTEGDLTIFTLLLLKNDLNDLPYAVRCLCFVVIAVPSPLGGQRVILLRRNEAFAISTHS